MTANGDSPDEHATAGHDDTTTPELPAGGLEELLEKYANLAARMHQASLERDKRDRERDDARRLYEAEMSTKLAGIEGALSDLRLVVDEIKRGREAGAG